jgi:hypothetical protein
VGTIADPAPATGVRRRAKRPVAVTFVALLALAAGLYHLAAGAITVADGGSSAKLAEGAVDVALGVVALAIGRGAFRLAPWAWAAFMTWAVIGLTHQLLRHFFYDDTGYGALAIDAAVVLALTPLDIQVAFGVRRRPSLALDGETDVRGSGL